MPPRVDLTGRRFGTLTIQGAGDEPKTWICRCDCGRAEIYPARRIPSTPSAIKRRDAVFACSDCRAGACEICGAPIAASSAALTCSPACAAERKRQYQIGYYHTKCAADPAKAAERRDRERARRETMTADQRREATQRSADWARANREAVRTAARERHADRMATDPDYAETHRVKTAAWRAAHPDETRAADRDYRRRQRTSRVAREIGEILETTRTKGTDK